MSSKPSVALQVAQIDWQNEIPFMLKYGDSYYSHKDGLEETRYNFLQHNFLAQRFAQLQSHQTFRIVETGFGSGLNLLATWQLWRQTAPKGAKLHFISFELHPVLQQDLHKIHQRFPEVASLGECLQQRYPKLLPGWHQIELDESVTLSLYLGDVQKGLQECDHSPMAAVDAWFLDGFAPGGNPQMWQSNLYQHMARLSHAQTTFATFTVVGHVRRGLEAVGFKVEKDKGFAGKREMCFGHYASVRPHHHKTPWFARSASPVSGKRVAIIGAGLAGAACAARLVQEGFAVTVFEAQSEIATQASGNLAGTIHPLITSDWNLRSQWYHAGIERSLQWLEPALERGQIEGELSGIMQLAAEPKLLKVMQDALERVNLPGDYAQFLDAQQVSAKLGQRSEYEGVWFPRGGWVQPSTVVKALLSHPAITVCTNHSLVDWEREGQAWQLKLQVDSQPRYFAADAVVFATGSLGESLQQRLHLPIRPVKGQVSHLTAEQVQTPLPFPVTHKGYSSRAANGLWVSGATFEAPDMSTELTQQAHETNLTHARNALPQWLCSQLEQELGQGRIAFRPTTPDHLPIVGAVPDWAWLEQNYLSQSHTHAVYRYPELHTQPGLFVSNGHGARGLGSVFLAADIIAAELTAQALPVAQSLYHASHSARFLIREWRRGKLSKKD